VNARSNRKDNRKNKKSVLARSASCAVERLEGRAYLSATSTVFGQQKNTSAASAGISPSFDWLTDLNADGKADLIVANSNSTVGVLLGNGDGSFQTPGVNYPVTGAPLPLLTADMNGDAKPDIIVGTAGDVSILLNNGNGTFAGANNIPALKTNQAIGVGAFVDGGPQDIVTVSNNPADTQNIAIVFTDGSGHLSAETPFTISHGGLAAVAVGDFGNGHEDIAVLSQTDHTVTILLGNGNGTFQAPVDYQTGASPTSLAIGDFNGDGKQDIVTANSTAGTVSFLAGRGDGTFAAKVDTAVAGSATGGGPLKVRVATFRPGSNKNDLFVLLSPGGSGDVSALLGQGNGTFQNIQPIRTGSTTRTAIAVGDLNADGLTDIVVSDPSQVSSLINVTNQDTTPPTAAVNASQVPGSTQSNLYQFTVTYADNQQVDAATVTNNPSNLVVTFPGGAQQVATLVSQGLVSGASVAATYQITFPSNLSTTNNGTYTVTINASTVSDANGNFVPAGAIGQFALNVSATQPPPTGGGGGGTIPVTGDFTVSGPLGKLPASAIIGGARQKGPIRVALTNTSGKLLTGTVGVTLYASSTPILDSSAVALAPATFRKVKNLKNGKGFILGIKPFKYPLAAGNYYLVAAATLNGNADSNYGATTTTVVTAAAFVDIKSVSAATTKPTLAANKVYALPIILQNIGNVTATGLATVNVYASASGVIDSTAVLVAVQHVHLGIPPGVTRKVTLHFKPTTLPAAGSYKLIVTTSFPGDADPANDTVVTAGTLTV